MENMIVLADKAGATIKNLSIYDSVIVFTEEELNEFVNLIVAETKKDK